MPWRYRETVAALAGAAVLAALAGCGGHGSRAGDGDGLAGVPADVLAGARPIGRGPRFLPAMRGPIVGACRPLLGRRDGVHLEVFAENQVVVVAAGIGVRPPVRRAEGRIVAARCFGAVTTVEPTGVLLVRPDARLHLGDVFRAWGQPLDTARVAGFHAAPGGRVRVYVGGRPWRRTPAAVPLTRHAQIVVELGPYVPPHRSYTFPPGA
jgi:hypothetical protein